MCTPCCTARFGMPSKAAAMPRTRYRFSCSPSMSSAAASGREVAVVGGQDWLYSQKSGVTEELFRGDRLGVDADIATGDMRQSELRSLAHLPDDFAPPPRFLERIAMHLAKNALVGNGQMACQVPLLMGIWGHKGAGKSFNLELSCKIMGVQPIIISAGELEDERAGEPGLRLRERYRFASRYAANTGVATCLIINDLDAGVGRYANTGNTVNTQNVQGTLMAICDDPSTVSTGQDWDATKRMPRVPIYVTANDLTCLYAPLVREGRMDKFFFKPTEEETAALLARLFEPDLSSKEAAQLLESFPLQSLDFFSAVMSRLADDAVRAWLLAAGGAEAAGAALLGAEADYANDASAWRGRSRVTVQPGVTLASALKAGVDLAREQQHVLDLHLAREYMPGLLAEASSGGAATVRDIGWRQQVRKEAAPPPPMIQRLPNEMSEELRSYWEHLSDNTIVSSRQAADVDSEAEQARRAGAEIARQEESALSRGWPLLSPDQVHAAMREGRAVLDLRSAREWDWGKIKGAVHCPVVLTTGTSMDPGTKPNPGFLDLVTARFKDKAQALILYGSAQEEAADAASAAPVIGAFVSKALSLGGSEQGDYVALAVAALQGAGYSVVSELEGGYRAWDLAYRPDGRRREKGKWADKSSGELEWWTASN